MNLLDLPEFMIEEIFSKLTYDEIAKKRLVCSKINRICQNLLNRGFYKMIKKHSTKLRTIKAQLPRRESERRNHPLSKHVDILTCIETRISMLSMTFTKYIEANICCFIPGKIIDEVFNIFRVIDTAKHPLRTHDILQELRDISSMAIEHFDEKIAHILKKSYFGARFDKSNYLIEHMSPFAVGSSLLIPSRSLFSPSTSGTSTTTTTQIKNSSNSHNQCPEAIKNSKMIELMSAKYRTAMKRVKQLVCMQRKHTQQIKNSSIQITQLSSQIVELKRRLEESDAKNREQSVNLLKSNNPTNNFTSNIKPRTATIILKRRITEPSAMIVKRFKSNSENELYNKEDNK